MEIPVGSKYEIATRAKRKRDKRAAMFAYFADLFLLLCTIMVFVAGPIIAYWIWEFAASIIIDAFVYAILPLFVIGVFVAICQNWKNVKAALWRAYVDMVRMVV